ncbi:MAG TPA: molecular chaperone DnaJ [Rhodospirillaceae bacterium]|nr:molecular chaperone DnaJ [Rhodospirillaceae bacterium]
MTLVVAGCLLLVAIMMVARWFVTASPAIVLRTAKWTGVLLALGGGTLLMVSGRLGWLLALVAGLSPWVLRAMHARNALRAVRFAFERMAPGGPGPGRVSRVETQFLRMTLDHDAGTLSGEILDGPFRGRKLSQLSFDEAIELSRQCAADSRSAQVLEAWLDRTWPDWAERSASRQPPPPAPGGEQMSRAEALDVLGLSGDAKAEDIKAAHRRLMGLIHPDRGGSNYLAAKINRAKDILLND